jgi:hypothetical protein
MHSGRRAGAPGIRSTSLWMVSTDSTAAPNNSTAQTTQARRPECMTNCAVGAPPLEPAADRPT